MHVRQSLHLPAHNVWCLPAHNVWCLPALNGLLSFPALNVAHLPGVLGKGEALYTLRAHLVRMPPVIIVKKYFYKDEF